MPAASFFNTRRTFSPLRNRSTGLDEPGDSGSANVMPRVTSVTSRTAAVRHAPEKPIANATTPIPIVPNVFLCFIAMTAFKVLPDD